MLAQAVEKIKAFNDALSRSLRVAAPAQPSGPDAMGVTGGRFQAAFTRSRRDITVAQGSTPMPPLLKGYLRMGARVCGEPCHDPDFNCLDFFILLAIEDLPCRYVQHFLQPAETLVGQAV